MISKVCHNLKIFHLAFMLSSTDIFLLSDDSPCKAVVSHGVELDIGRKVREDLIRLFSISNEQNPQLAYFQKAGIGSSKKNLKTDSTVRGDYRCWLTPSITTENNLVGVRELAHLIMKTCCSQQLKAYHKLNGDYSIQATLYPGNGARYVRHLDAAQTSSSHRGTRRLTFVYYLNETTACSGGNLRLYNLPRRTTGTSTTAETCLEVKPTLGTMVVFRSDQVEHEVLPSYKDRWAISVWAYCDTAADTATNSLQSTTSLPEIPVGSSSLEQLIQQFLPARGPVRLPPPLPAIAAMNAYPAEHHSSIFVSIVSYRDPELPATVRSLVRTAQYPCRLRLGVVYQLGPGDEESCRLHKEHLQACWEPHNSDSSSSNATCTCDICTSMSDLNDLQCSEHFLAAQVRTLTLPHCEAKGPISARSLALGLYGGERYHLQVDSHMRFRPGWDVYLVGLLENLRETESGPKGACRPVLTTYPQGYRLPDSVPDDTRPTVLMPSHFDAKGLLRQVGKLLECTQPDDSCNRVDPQQRRRYFRSPLWAAGFSFSDAAALLLDAPYSPHLPRLFFGEEQCMAARLFTHGYDFFAPGETVLYHLYTRTHRPAFQTDPSGYCKDSQTEAVRRELISREKTQSLEIVQNMLALLPLQQTQGQDQRLREEREQVSSRSKCTSQDEVEENHLRLLRTNQKRYGLGNVRTLQEFYDILRQVGVTFTATCLQDEMDGHVYVNVEQRLAFLCSCDIGAAEKMRWKFARTATVEVAEVAISQDTVPLPPPLQQSGGTTGQLDPRMLQHIAGFF